MIKNLNEFFLPEQEFYLDKVNYNRLPQTSNTKEFSLNCIDSIETTLMEDGINILVTRTLKFNPNEIFELSVSFGVNLKFNKDMKRNFEWNDIEWENEFRQNGDFVLANIMSRISLLISEITASYGQMPLVLPPSFNDELYDE